METGKYTKLGGVEAKEVKEVKEVKEYYRGNRGPQRKEHSDRRRNPRPTRKYGVWGTRRWKMAQGCAEFCREEMGSGVDSADGISLIGFGIGETD